MKTHGTNATRSGEDAWVAQTMLVRRSRQVRSDIDVHKWYESEKAGCDIGWHRATISYAVHMAMQHQG